jgi:hypothetical protein
MLWWDFTIDHWRIVLVSVSNEEGVELLILCPTRGKVQSHPKPMSCGVSSKNQQTPIQSLKKGSVNS